MATRNINALFNAPNFKRKKAPNDSTSDGGLFTTKEVIPSQVNKANQVTACNVPAVVHAYLYSQYENEVTGLVSEPTLTSKCQEVLAVNDRLIVLNDEFFTSLTIDGTNYAGKNGLDTPALYAYIDDPYFGNGIIFTLSSSKPLSSYELYGLICNKLNSKTARLVDIEFTLLKELQKCSKVA